jgi:hypothetical protein
MNKKIVKVLFFTGLSVASIYGTNKLINYIAKSKKTDTDNKYNIMRWRNGDISYTKKGKGKPLLLIHDLKPYSSSKEWENIKNNLAKHYCVYTIDLLGCGNSDKPGMTYTNYLYVQLITDFIKTVIGDKTSIIVSGDSGSFVTMACNMYPQFFNKIILLNPTKLDYYSMVPNKTKNVLKYLIDTPIIGTFLYNMIFTQSNIKKHLEQKSFFRKHIIPNKLITNYYVSSHENDSKGKFLYSSICSCYTNINITFALRKINHSIAIIAGEEKENIREIIDEYQKINPSIEYALISETAEYPHIEKPKAFLENARIYLDS